MTKEGQFNCPVLGSIANVEISYEDVPASMKAFIDPRVKGFNCKQRKKCGVETPNQSGGLSPMFDWSICPHPENSKKQVN